MTAHAMSRLLLAIAALTIPASAVSAETLRVAMESRLSNLDPIVSASHQTRDHGYLIYDTLLALDADQNIRPQMAEGWEVSEDGKTYVFRLRDGLTWHDGQLVTAADVVASFERWAQRDRLGQAVLTVVDDIEVLDDKEFRVELSEPTTIILDAFAKSSGVTLFIMPERVAQTPLSEAITDYTGSGPFIFVPEEFEPGVRALYRKNPDYVPRSEQPSWLAGGKVAKVDEIERIEMADPLTSLNALLNGEIDYLQTIPFDLMSLVPEDGEITKRELDTIGYQLGYRFNTLQKPFDDRLTRLAAMHAIGQEEALKVQFGSDDFYAICGAAFGCGLPYESQNLAEVVVESNIAQAQELLSQSNYDGETVLIFHVTDLSAMSSIPLVMAQQLREAGFTVELQSMDFMTMLSRRANKGSVDEGGWSIFVTSWHNTEIQDPIRSFMVSAVGEGGYAGWINVPEIEELRREFLVASSEQERRQLAERIQTLAYEHGVFAPLGSYRRVTGLGPGVEGAIESPANIFWNISKNAN